MEVDDRIEVDQKKKDWWCGRNQRTKAVQWFPAAFVEELPLYFKRQRILQGVGESQPTKSMAEVSEDDFVGRWVDYRSGFDDEYFFIVTDSRGLAYVPDIGNPMRIELTEEEGRWSTQYMVLHRLIDDDTQVWREREKDDAGKPIERIFHRLVARQRLFEAAMDERFDVGDEVFAQRKTDDQWYPVKVIGTRSGFLRVQFPTDNKEEAFVHPGTVKEQLWTVGDFIEVYSKSMKTWCPGTVREINADEGCVRVEYDVDGSTVGEKYLPFDDDAIRFPATALVQQRSLDREDETQA